jgi:mRNA-degrading endonuclease toxin of MazEF toxin-antitoxin module
VVVSNDAANLASNRVHVVPISSNVARIHSWEAAVIVQGRACKAMADQIRIVAKERLLGLIGNVSMPEMAAIERAVKLQLNLT